MGYNGLTNFGIEYQARMTAENKPVTLTKVRVGNGSIPASQTGATTTNLYSYKKEVEILAKEQIENAVKLQILLNNLDQETGFYVKELGVYVQDGVEEKLYWYINKDNPSYLDDKNVPSKHPADSRKIPRVPRYSGYHYASFSFEYRTITVYGPIFQRVLLTKFLATSWSYNPNIAVTTLVWANPRSLATTWGIIIIFFSCRY